jgi:hypothetical protein
MRHQCLPIRLPRDQLLDLERLGEPRGSLVEGRLERRLDHLDPKVRTNCEAMSSAYNSRIFQSMCAVNVDGDSPWC